MINKICINLYVCYFIFHLYYKVGKTFIRSSKIKNYSMSRKTHKAESSLGRKYYPFWSYFSFRQKFGILKGKKKLFGKKYPFYSKKTFLGNTEIRSF